MIKHELGKNECVELSSIKFSQAYFWLSDESEPHFVFDDCFAFQADKLIIEGGALGEDGTSYNFRSINGKNFYYKVEDFQSYEGIKHCAFLKKPIALEGKTELKKIKYRELWREEEESIVGSNPPQPLKVFKPYTWCFAGFDTVKK